MLIFIAFNFDFDLEKSIRINESDAFILLMKYKEMRVE